MLADRAGVDRKLIYRTELGQTSPRLDAVVMIADALDVSVAELFACVVDDANRDADVPR